MGGHATPSENASEVEKKNLDGKEGKEERDTFLLKASFGQLKRTLALLLQGNYYYSTPTTQIIWQGKG